MIRTHDEVSLRREAQAIMHEWGQGAAPDAAEALARRPELRADKAVVLDLAYEEYCLRCDAGVLPDVDDYCDRFPTYRQSLHRLIAAHQILAENVDQLTEIPRVRWPEPGERLGDLTMLRDLGRGAFARVYLALEESTGDRPVVVKMSPEGAAEARTMGRLNHPNIVPVLSARFEGSAGLTAICMPYLGAATLTDVLDCAFPTPDAAPPRQAEVILQAARSAIRSDEPPPASAGAPGKRANSSYTDGVACLALQIAEALAFLHREGVCHRDLKPSNVLLRPDGRALLLDFNLSADARAALPRLGGTLPYMAPEQLRALTRAADGDDLDGRADVFALGVILYELLTGKHPFGTTPSGRSPAAAASILLERQRSGFAPVRTLNRDVDRGLARLVEDCLAFDPAGRPASAAVLAAGFRRYLSPPARLWRSALHKPLVMAAALGLVLLAAGGAAANLANRQPADVRAYQLGRDAYRAADYGLAEQWFRQAMADFPMDVKPRSYYLAHAEALLRLGEENDDDAKFSLADQDLVEVRQQQSDGAAMALSGYCKSRLKQDDRAVYWYNQADAAGFTSAALYNDRGYSYLQLFKDTNNVKKAQDDIDKALQLDPNMQQALYNRALIVLRHPQSIPDGLPIPDATLAGMLLVADSSPPGKQMYLKAAKLCAMSAQRGGSGDPGLRASQALVYLRKAVECGQDPARLDNDLAFPAVLGQSPDYQALLKTVPGPARDSTRPQWANPAPELPK